MIDLIFQFGGEMVLVKIDGSSVMFGSTSNGAKLAPISGLKLSKLGVLVEHPDLEDDEMWRDKAISRFKEHIISLSTEKNRAEYIIKDLKNHGYSPKRMQINGRRPERIS